MSFNVTSSAECVTLYRGYCGGLPEYSIRYLIEYWSSRLEWNVLRSGSPSCDVTNDRPKLGLTATVND